MSIKLNEKARGEAQKLLGEYQTICDMLNDIKRPSFRLTITASNDADDFAEVEVSEKNARVLLEAERQWTVTELKKLGIEV
jgi:hypothetical protein